MKTLFFHPLISINTLSCATTLTYSHFSDSYGFKSGVPQGSVLGPILFLVYINDLISEIFSSTNCIPLAFADDLCIIPNIHINSYRNSNGILSATNIKQYNEACHIRLQKALPICSKWSYQWRMKFSSSKSNIVMFKSSSSYCIHSFPSFALNNEPLEYSKNYTYLGLTFSYNLKWEENSNRLIQKCNVMSYFINRLINYESDINIILKLVNATTKAAISYALPFWSPSPTTFNKLNSLLIHPFRRLLAPPPSSHIASMFYDLGQCPVQVLKEYETLTVGTKLLKNSHS